MDDFGPEADFDPTLAEENPDDWALIDISETVLAAERSQLTLDDLPGDAVRPHVFWQTYMALVAGHSDARLFAGDWRNVGYMADFCRRLSEHALLELLEDLEARLRDLDPNRLDAHPDYGSRHRAAAGNADAEVETMLWDRRIEALIITDYEAEDRPLLRAANLFASNTMSGRVLHDSYVRPLLANPAIERRNRERVYQNELARWRREARIETSLAHLHRQFLNNRNIDGVYPQDRITPSKGVGLQLAELSHGGRDYLLATYRDGFELVDAETGETVSSEPHAFDWGTERKHLWRHRYAPGWTYDRETGRIETGRRTGLIGRIMDMLGL